MIDFSRLKTLFNAETEINLKIVEAPAHYGGPFWMVQYFTKPMAEWIRLADFVRKEHAENFILILESMPELIRLAEIGKGHEFCGTDEVDAEIEKSGRRLAERLSKGHGTR